MSHGTTTANKPLMDCPACGRPIVARLTFDLTVGEPEGKDLPVSATLSGLHVVHDCTPKVTR